MTFYEKQKLIEDLMRLDESALKDARNNGMTGEESSCIRRAIEELYAIKNARRALTTAAPLCCDHYDISSEEAEAWALGWNECLEAIWGMERRAMEACYCAG